MKKNINFIKCVVFVSFILMLLNNPAFGGNISYSVLDYGAKGDSVTDNTEAFQKALDEASKVGAIVTIPHGLFLIKGNLKISNVSLVGVNKSPRLVEPLKGTVILATGGRDDENAPPLFQLLQSANVKGITVPPPCYNCWLPIPWVNLYQLSDMLRVW